MRLSWIVACSALALVGCGGSGGGSAGSGATGSTGSSPTPSPSSPTPTPGTTGETKPTASTAAFATGQILTVTGSTQTLSGGATTGRSVTGINGAFALGYNATSRTYTLTNEERTQTFAPATFFAETSPPDYFPRVEFHSAGSATADFLVFFKQANATPAIATNFSAYGAWQHNDVQPAGTRVRLDYFVYGTPTPAASMPHSGTVTYRWSGTGNYAEDGRLYFTQSYNTMTVNFATGEVKTNIVLTGTDFLSNNFGGLIGVNYTGTISGNAADGPLSFSAATWSGNAHIVFFGPNAENVGIVYSAASPVVGTFNGAAVGTTP